MKECVSLQRLKINQIIFLTLKNIAFACINHYLCRIEPALIFKTHKMEKIIVAVDFSDIATLAIDYAASFALAFKSHVHILHVEPPALSYIGNEILPPVMPMENEEENERVKRDLLAMAEYLQQRGVDADYELVKGPIAETIVEIATNYQADLIILGAHNHGFLYRAFIGSVSTGVLKHSPCPVMIIPAK